MFPKIWGECFEMEVKVRYIFRIWIRSKINHKKKSKALFSKKREERENIPDTINWLNKNFVNKENKEFKRHLNDISN